MKIRPEQMNAMAEYSRRQFQDRLIRDLRREYPEETAQADDDELRAVVVEQIDKAVGYGIVLEDDLAIYVDRAAYYGDDWDSSLDWVRGILNDEQLDGSAKIEEIRRYEAVELDWEVE